MRAAQGRESGRGAALADALLLVVSGVALILWLGGRQRFGLDQDLVHSAARACADRGDCPLVGPAVQATGIFHAPLYVYFAAAGEWMGLGPRELWQAACFAAGSAGVLVRRAAVPLVGKTGALLATLLFLTSASVVEVLEFGSNLGWLPLPLAAFCFAAISRDKPRVLLASTSLAIASTLHVVTLTLVPACLLLGVSARPPLRRWGVWALPWAVLYAPWVLHVARGGLDGANPMQLTPELDRSFGHSVAVALSLAWPLALLGWASQVRRAPRGAARAAVLAAVLLPLLFWVLAFPFTALRHAVALQPWLAIGGIAGAALVARFVHERWQRRVRHTQGAVYVMVALLYAPSVGGVDARPRGIPLEEQQRLLHTLGGQRLSARSLIDRVHGADWNRDHLGLLTLSERFGSSSPRDDREAVVLGGPGRRRGHVRPLRGDVVAEAWRDDQRCAGPLPWRPAVHPALLQVFVSMPHAEARLRSASGSRLSPPAVARLLEELRLVRPLARCWTSGGHLQLVPPAPAAAEDVLVVVHERGVRMTLSPEAAVAARHHERQGQREITRFELASTPVVVAIHPGGERRGDFPVRTELFWSPAR